jgi:hypothetical protein
MKTPRDLLLARHQAANPKLDALRHAVVADLNRQGAKTRRPAPRFAAACRGWLQQVWLELVWPCRRTWAGLAVVWVLLLLINVSQHDRSPVVMARSSPPAAMMLTFRDQQKMLNDLFADHAPGPDVDRPRIFLPKPRTETLEQATV